MTARAAYAQVLYEDPEMNSLGFVQSRIYAANAADSPNQEGPFVVIVSGGFTKAFGITGADTVSYWVHQPIRLGRDYSLIDRALNRIEYLLTNVTQFHGEDGWVLTAASWIDRSRDLTDTAYNTLVKYSSFRTAVHDALVTP